MKIAACFLIFNLIHRSYETLEGFVAGGQFGNIAHFPHSAFLAASCTRNTQGKQNAKIKSTINKQNKKSQENWICGSAILNQKILLTAAHCVAGCEFSDTSTDRIIAYMGNSDLKKVTIKRKIIDVAVHMNYNETTVHNDIAVAAVKRDIPFGINVKRVIISRKFPDNAIFYSGYVAGWGLVSEQKQSMSLRLKYVHQTLRSKVTCSLLGKMHKGVFCAGTTEKNAASPAQGDSGSALVTDRGALQIGVVSFCLVKRYPALLVYTNVSYYYQWIATHSQILYCRNKL